MIEAICRQYITGSMWRGYLKGEREICGIRLDDNLKKDQKLDQLPITPFNERHLTGGGGLEGVPEVDDVNIPGEISKLTYQPLNLTVMKI